MTAPRVYYNEYEPYAAEWLENLIKNGLIADGEVDRRSIVDVSPDDLRGFTQCHFFAGIGVWSYALRLAGWPDDRPVWTGSCPCQPFSAAGKQKGFADERHLWPAWFRLIDACRPPVIFGEQVASAEVVGKVAKPGGRKAVRNRLSHEAPGEGPGAPCGASGAEEGDFFRSLGSPSGFAGEDRYRPLRGDGTSAEPEGREDVGQSVSRSHRPSERLRLLECARGLSWREQRDGGLGGTAADRDGESYLGYAEAEIERLLASFGRAASGEADGPWLDVVFHDLERVGYAAGAHVLPACGIGAPHIRQRLWFVAQRLADALGRGRGEQPPEQRADGGGGGGYPDLRGGDVELGDADRPRHEGHGLQPILGGGEGRGSLGGAPGSGAVGGLDAPAGARHLREIEGSEGAARHEARMRLPGEGRGSDGLADAEHDDRRADEPGRGSEERGADGRSGATLRMADADDPRLEGRRGVQERRGEFPAGPGGLAGGLAHADGGDASAEGLQRGGQHGQQPEDGRALQGGWPGPTNGHWAAADWLHCRDGKFRPVEPGTFPLVNGAPARVGRLRAYGNAIVAQVAAEVIAAFMECRP